MNSRIPLEAINGVVAMLPTPSLPGADNPHHAPMIDLAETERATHRLIDSGVCAIMTNGSLGEMATLSLEEWRIFNEAVIATARARNPHFPVFVGATALSTHATIELARAVEQMGGGGIFLGRPFWCALDAKGMIDFYEAVCESVPSLSVILYDNPEAFKGPIPTSVYARLAEIPQIVAAKYLGLTPKFNADMAAIDGRMRLLPIEVEWFTARAMWPDSIQACWSSTVACGPLPVMELARRIEVGDAEGARDLTKRIARTYAPFLAMRNFPEFAKYNIPLEKERFNEAGFIATGPSRHPYHTAPAEYLEGSREMAHLWSRLCDDLAKERAVLA